MGGVPVPEQLGVIVKRRQAGPTTSPSTVPATGESRSLPLKPARRTASVRLCPISRSVPSRVPSTDAWPAPRVSACWLRSRVPQASDRQHHDLRARQEASVAGSAAAGPPARVRTSRQSVDTQSGSRVPACVPVPSSQLESIPRMGRPASCAVTVYCVVGSSVRESLVAQSGRPLPEAHSLPGRGEALYHVGPILPSIWPVRKPLRSSRTSNRERIAAVPEAPALVPRACRGEADEPPSSLTGNRSHQRRTM